MILELVQQALDAPEGCLVEVGVWKGGTAQRLCAVALMQNRDVYLYDTFTGIPYKDDVDLHKVGDFGDTSYETVRDALPLANVIPGIFPDSAVDMPPIAFAHIDCDQYRSVKNSIEYLLPRMVKGGTIWFDDYCLEGAKKAIDEAFSEHKTSRTNKVFIVV